MRGTTQLCDITKIKDPHIAIARIDDGNQPGAVRGYQLVVIDRDQQQRCTGSQLVGVVFDRLYAGHDDPVMVRAVAKTKVIPDRISSGACFLDEYRMIYMITAAFRPRDSLCNYGLRNNPLRRLGRAIKPSEIPPYPSPEVSPTLAELPEADPEHLDDYAVIIPDADYDTNGNPDSSTDPRPVPDRKLEWYELACGGSALADTDLKGLVELGEDKDTRTAAMRMLQAKYRNSQTETIRGIQISVRRDKPHSEEYKALCQFPSQHANIQDIKDDDIEARWTVQGALCASHSRLWIKDSVIYQAQSYQGPTLEDRERQFLERIQKLRPAQNGPQLPPLLVPCQTSADDNPGSGSNPVYFTSGVIHHIHDDRGTQARPPTAAVKNH